MRKRDCAGSRAKNSTKKPFVQALEQSSWVKRPQNPHEYWVFGIIKVSSKSTKKRSVIMRDNATEIKKVLDEHQYSINTIIVEVMGTFKLNSIIRKAGFAK